MKKTTIIINGTGRCGKDSFAEFCGDILSKQMKVINISTVDKVKAAATILGWDQGKTEESRLALSELKSLSKKHFNHPIQYILNRKAELDEWYSFYLMFVHSRESEEIGWFKNNIENCYTLLIKNPSVADITTNESDARVEDYDYDYIIHNDGSLEDLKMKAKDFISILKGENRL